MPPDAPIDPEALVEARRWLRFAIDDLASARLHVATSLVLPNQACYHAQQAAEKALKALLILHGVGFPKTHDLVALAARLPAHAVHVVADADLPGLTAWITAARYPTDLPEATSVAASTAIQSADRVLERTRLLINSHT